MNLGRIQLSNNKYRTEKDSMGEFQVPSDAYYGANTMRAVLNFPISELRFSRSFINAIATIKKTAAEVNVELGLLESKLATPCIRTMLLELDGVKLPKSKSSA